MKHIHRLRKSSFDELKKLFDMLSEGPIISKENNYQVYNYEYLIPSTPEKVIYTKVDVKLRDHGNGNYSLIIEYTEDYED